MEDFVTELKDNIGINTEITQRKTSKIKGLLTKIISSNPEIRSIKCNTDGDTSFEVSMKSIGITSDVILKYREEITSEFTANFLGEFFIRDNMEKFAKLITDLKDNYLDKINKYEHRKFGMSFNGDKVIFSFHISLIQNILTEDFRKKIV